MDQKQLWDETLETAVDALAEAVGGTKQLAHELRPSMEPEDAARWLATCFNKTRRERLSAEDLMRLMKIGRRVGCHVVTAFLAYDAGYEAPKPRELAREIERTAQDVASLQAQILRSFQQLQNLQSLLNPSAGGGA